MHSFSIDGSPAARWNSDIRGARYGRGDLTLCHNERTTEYSDIQFHYSSPLKRFLQSFYNSTMTFQRLVRSIDRRG